VSTRSQKLTDSKYFLMTILIKVLLFLKLQLHHQNKLLKNQKLVNL